tara:strand:+ start:72 stop:287 length:216 start_codon:yes stop_codon:yes gene_type:complete
MSEPVIKEEVVCTGCGGNRIVVDAWTKWSIEEQDWVLGEIFDEIFCRDCDSSADYELIPLEEYQERRNKNE